jgi:hypothetical protein
VKKVLVVLLALVAVVGAGCKSNADTASDNLSKEAERFQIQRRIVGINGITDKVLFTAEGKCSVEYGDTMAGVYDVICKHGPRDYRKHYIGASDNLIFISTQIEGIAVDEYHTKFILRPTSIVPDVDIMTGD